MHGFVNTFNGADFNDVYGWAVHLREQFPERQDAIDAALHLPMPEQKRQIAVRRIVEAQIESLLREAEAGPCRRAPLDTTAEDPAKVAARVLARVGDPAVERFARRLGITVAEARQRLLERMAGGGSDDKL